MDHVEVAFLPPVRSADSAQPPLRLNAPLGLDKGLVADLRDEELSGGETYAKACEAIHREASEADLPLLRVLLLDESALVREAVAWPIADLEGLPALRDLLIAYRRGLDEGLDNDGFTTLLLEIAAGDPKGVKGQLQSLAFDPDSRVKETALWLLTHCDAALDA